MKRKILWIVIPLLMLVISGGVLWWRGGQILKAQEQAKLEQERLAAQKLEDALQAIPISAIDTISQAIAQKAERPKPEPLARLDLEKISQNRYSISDLKLANNETVPARNAYRTGIKNILDNYVASLTGNETAAMHRTLEGTDSMAIKIITGSRQNIQIATNRLLDLTIPPSAVILHLNLLNSLASLGQIIYNMSQVNSEPLLAVESAEHRVSKYSNVVSAISAIDRYLANPVILP